MKNAIKKLRCLSAGAAAALFILFPAVGSYAADVEQKGSMLSFPTARLSTGAVTARLAFKPAPGFKLNDRGPFSVSVKSNESDIIGFIDPPAALNSKSFPLLLSGDARRPGTTTVTFDIKAYFCTADRKRCFYRHVTATLPVIVESGAARRVALTVPLGGS